jgi:hypothetical protein
MKNIYPLFLITIILVVSFVLKAQFSREQAIDLVLNQIIVNEHPNIFASYDKILDGQTILPGFNLCNY